MLNIIDLEFLLIFVWCCWLAMRRGFLLAALNLFSWLAGLTLAFWAYLPLAHGLTHLFPRIDPYAAPLAFILVLMISELLLEQLAASLVLRIPKKFHESTLNKALGIIPGLINGFIWAAFLSALLVLLPFRNSLSQQTKASQFASRLSQSVQWLDNRLAPVFEKALNRNSPPVIGEERMTKLPFTVSDAWPRPDLEKEMLRLVNRERTARGLPALKADAEMTELARAHSRDMLLRGYFSHYTPEGVDPFGRMKKADLYFWTAGENIAITQTLQMAHEGLMHSPGHRANILNPGFGRLGIGILDAGIYGLMITQSFRD